MKLTNRSSKESSYTFRLDKDSGELYFSRWATIESWSGEPLYCIFRRDFVPAPLEFMFDESGRLSSLSVLIAGNVSMKAGQSQSLKNLLPLFTLPTTDLRPWTEEKSNVVEISESVEAWWNDDDLWVVRAQKTPSKAFDTKEGMMVIFDDEDNFIGIIIQSVGEERDIVERSAIGGYHEE